MKSKIPEGFLYIPDFLTYDEEQKLIDEITNIELHTFIFQGYEAKRKVASFGFDYSFDNRSLTKGNPIPDNFNWLLNKISSTLSIEPNHIAELLITEYPVGSVINWHRDAPPFDVIIGISLLADCQFRLRPQDKLKQNRSSIISFPVLRRSLYVMRGPSRSEWQHSILPAKQKRYSITLRTLRK
jgi:alkylated DNA repair dioxygenase AlkB